MKKLLILGGFPQMIDIVMTAKNLGIYTIVADRDPQSPAKRFANQAINLSTDKIDELELLCRAEHIDGIFTGFEDFNIHIACQLCSRLHLPFYATEEQLAVITNKPRFKDTCRSYGVPVVEQYTLEEACSYGKYPYIVKPADSYGSRGITVCRDYAALNSGLEHAVAISPSRTAIIERFIESDYGTELFYTIVNGSIHLTATADRYTTVNEAATVPLPVAEVFPSRHAAEMKNQLDPAIRRMLAGLGLQNGLVLIQALYANGEYFVYEMAFRLTGEQHYRMVERQNGIALSEFMIKLALGEPVSSFDTDLLNDTNFVYPSINYAVLLKPGTIRSITGLEQVYQIDEVISYNLTHKNQDVIHPSGDYSQMLIRVNMVSKSYPKLRHAVDAINRYIQVVSEDGTDMLAKRFQLPAEETL